MIELVVLPNRPTPRKGSDLRSYGLHFAPECYLALEYLVASGAILSLGKVTPIDEDSLNAHEFDL